MGANVLNKKEQETVKERARRRVERAYQIIEQTLQDVCSREKYLSFLEYGARMAQFDLNNVLMLWVQPVYVDKKKIKERATFVSGFLSWKKKNAMLKPASSGLLILMPYQPKINNQICKMTYTTGTVFDGCQTDCQESYLTHNPFKVKRIEDYMLLFRLLRSIAEKNGYYIHLGYSTHDDFLKISDHYHRFQKKEIVINIKNSDKEKIINGFYEYVYCLLYESLSLEEKSNQKITDSLSFLTESCLYMICHYYGITMESTLTTLVEEFKCSHESLKKEIQKVFAVFTYITDRIDFEYLSTEEERKEVSSITSAFFQDEEIKKTTSYSLAFRYMEMSILLTCFPPLEVYVYNEAREKELDKNGKPLKQRVNPRELQFKNKEELLRELSERISQCDDVVLFNALQSLRSKIAKLETKDLRKIERDYIQGKICVTERYFV